MADYNINTNEIRKFASKLCCGDTVYLSGTVFTARDAAHARIFNAINSGNPLPFEINNAVIYYAGPTPAKGNEIIGSCGPTTSSRMDAYTPALYNSGLACTIGKGDRSQAVYTAITKNKGLYLCAIGGAGALAAACISKCEIIAYDDLGCESVKKLEFNNFPLIVGIDTKGNSIFAK